MWHSDDQQRSHRRRSSIAKLAQFFGFGDVPSPAPPRFPPSSASSSSGGAIGLGIIVAAMDDDASKRPAISAALPRTEPLAVVAAPTTDEMEPSESCTCMISYCGGCPVGRGLYSGIVVDEVALFELPTPGELVLPPSQVGELLRRCFRCKEELDGLDIYMYRGEKAFCSSECRCHHILLEELKSHQHSLPPCSAPPLLAAEVAMA